MEQFKNLINSKILGIVRICDLIKINFKSCEKEICIHVQKALFRIVESEKLLVSSWDIGIPGKNYKRKLFQKFKWDIPGNTLYDDEINDNKDKLLDTAVIDVFSNGKDLILQLENNLRIEIIADTLQPEHEIYRVFELNNLESHYVIES